MTTSFTTTFRLQKPDFRSSGWGDQVNGNMDLLDVAILNALSASNTTPWVNNTAMVAGQVRIDTAVSPVTYWICAVSHTSATTPTTFAADRIAHPTFWTAFTFALKPRGAWAHSTAYAINDIAYDSTLGITGICKIAHTSNTLASGGTIQTDVANWDFIVNLPAMGVTAATSISFSNAVAALAGSPTNVQTAIEALDASNDTQGTTIASHTTSISTLNTNVGTNTTNIASNTSSISTLNTNMTTAQSDIVAHTGRLNTLDSEVAALGAGFPATTAMLFWQAAAPTGWTKSTVHNDKALRVVSGTGGGNGGTVAFTTVFGQSATGATTISTSTMPSHSHNVAMGGVVSGSGNFPVGGDTFTNNVADSAVGSGGSHTHGMDIRVQYLDLIVCTKN